MPANRQPLTPRCSLRPPAKLVAHLPIDSKYEIKFHASFHNRESAAFSIQTKNHQEASAARKVPGHRKKGPKKAPRLGPADDESLIGPPEGTHHQEAQGEHGPIPGSSPRPGSRNKVTRPLGPGPPRPKAPPTGWPPKATSKPAPLRAADPAGTKGGSGFPPQAARPSSRAP
ncbi:hypothetical protein NDU88_008098 [Pleurodeles waltl]|uniref:Uncharacterized protein n=1 Tax=Pleurodeles waltl TaxID=8319 RepID=A0AAV7U3G6_PLEWA|nr:hypothetical protein NDU88_008098 [Pleurodeles waltl]